MADALFPRRTEHLLLRFHEEHDEQDLLRVYSRDDVARYLLEEPWTAEQTAERLAKRITRRTLFDEPHALSLIIEDEHGDYVGDLALWLTDVEHRQAEIGWVRDPGHPGRGLISEAASALIALAFGPLEVHRIAAEMDARNDASAALARRLGFRFEGHMLEDLHCKGEYTDTFVFGLLARDLTPT